MSEDKIASGELSEGFVDFVLKMTPEEVAPASVTWLRQFCGWQMRQPPMRITGKSIIWNIDKKLGLGLDTLEKQFRCSQSASRAAWTSAQPATLPGWVLYVENFLQIDQTGARHPVRRRRQFRQMVQAILRDPQKRSTLFFILRTAQDLDRVSLWMILRELTGA